MNDENVQKYSQELKSLGIEFFPAEHPELKTPAEVQNYLGLTMADGFSTMFMKADDSYLAIIRRDDCRIDMKKVKKLLGIKNLRIATNEEFSQVTGLEPGSAKAVLPVKLTILDSKLFEKEVLTGGTGSFTVSFRYKSNDLKKIPGSQVMGISEAPIESGGGTRRIFAGMRPTGRLHLGNYLGSAKGMLALQDNPQFETIFMVVDLHGMTTPYDKDSYQENIKNVMRDYLAVGLDPEKSILTVQSRVPEHTELAFLLSTVTTIAKMTHLPTFKEKVKQYPEHSTMALLNYPVLMAADILLYKGELVPVGIDQEPHIEVAREVARRMNQEFGTNFPEPKRFATRGEYVPSLTGEGKMSKSVEGSYISLSDDLATITAKLAKAPTDAGGPGEEPKEGPVANLFKFVELFRPDRLSYYASAYNQGKIRYSEMKQELAVAIFEELKPIQERRNKITDEEVEKVIAEGAEKARKVAGETLGEVKEKMGLI